MGSVDGARADVWMDLPARWLYILVSSGCRIYQTSLTAVTPADEIGIKDFRLNEKPRRTWNISVDNSTPSLDVGLSRRNTTDHPPHSYAATTDGDSHCLTHPAANGHRDSHFRG